MKHGLNEQDLNKVTISYITDKSIKHQSFVYAQLNVKTVLFITIQLNTGHFFALRLNVI